MSMTRAEFREIAETLAEAADWAERDDMTPEKLRQAIGERLLTICRASYSGSYSFDTGKFRRVAKLDD